MRSGSADSATSALRASIDGRGAARATQTSATRQLKVGSSLGVQYVQIMDAALTKALRVSRHMKLALRDS